MRGPAPGVLLGRALTAAAARSGVTVAVEDCGSQAWHSATFSGHRHALVMIAPADPAASAWLATIGDLDVRLPRQLLADLSVTLEGERDGSRHLRIDALTVAEA
jgi:hypothetical protein